MIYSQSIHSRVVHFAFLMLLSICFSSIPARITIAEMGWNSKNSYLIPLSWCIVHGSPNLTGPFTAGATNPSDVILARMSRPTNGIFASKAGIILRSAYAPWPMTIRDPITKHVYSGPKIPKYENAGEEGDIYEPSGILGTSSEIQEITKDCSAQSSAHSTNYGLIAIHLNRFIKENGSYSDAIGAGSCYRSSAGQCATPYNGRIYVADNYWLHTSRPPNFSLFFYRYSDPVDIVVAHEVGHALGLEHEHTSDGALMFPSLTDKNKNDLIADNTTLSTTEIERIRKSAENIPGVQIDPDGKFESGRFIATRRVDNRADVDAPVYLDLTTVDVVLDKRKNLAYLDVELGGLVPKNLDIPFDLWFLIDADQTVAIDSSSLPDWGIPDLNLAGMEVLAHIQFINQKVLAEVFHLVDGNLTLDNARAELLTNTLELFYATPDAAELQSEPNPVELNHVIRLMLPNTVAGIVPAAIFRAQVMITQEGDAAVKDALDESSTSFQINDPNFAECIPLGDALPGKSLQVEVRKMLPNATIYGSLGDQINFTGEIGGDGKAVFEVEIPSDTIPGYRSLSVAVDGAPITADCLINVIGASSNR